MADEKKSDKDKVDEEIKKSRAVRDAARRDVTRVARERRKIVDQIMMKQKGWRHPVNIVVTGWYHQCAACGGPVNDEVVVVIERLRSGDRITVFCDKICMVNHSEW